MGPIYILHYERNVVNLFGYLDVKIEKVTQIYFLPLNA